MAQPTFADRRSARRAAGQQAPLPARHALAHAALAALAALGSSQAAQANPAPAASTTPIQVAAASQVAFEFSSELLAGGAAAKVDVSRFALGNPQLAGTYRADIFVNGRWLMRRDVRLGGNPVVPCIDAELLRMLGIAAEAFTPEGLAIAGPAAPRATAAASSTAQCQAIETLTRDAHTSFDAGELRLDITVPQASLARQPKGYVPPESWDRGVTAGLLGYNFNAYRSTGGNAGGDSYFLGLNGGLNLGRWRLRHNGSYLSSGSGAAHYNALASYATTDIPDWQAAVTLGDAFTTGQLFPSVKLRGAGLVSDERMLPESQRGYAPVIRGIANSNAKVEVRQNTNVLYSTSVPPGPFEINDLYPTGYGGDLQVVVTESDGSQRTTTLPYSSLPQLLRAGSLRFAAHAGQALGYQHRYELLQGTAQYGLSNDATLAAGLQVSSRYAALLAGGAWNTPIGAVQTNVTASSFNRAGEGRRTGWSFDASWAKVFPATGTNFNFAAYRYSSGGYFSLDDALRLQDYDASLYRGAYPGFRVRNRAVITVSQSLAGGLSFNLSANTQDYWGHQQRQSAFQFGVYKQFGPVQLSLNAQSSRDPFNAGTQRTYNLGLNIPLGGLGSNTRNTLTGSYSHDSVNGSSSQAGFYGSYGPAGELNYGVSHQRSPSGQTLSANAGYHAKYATLGATASSGRGISQQSISASGGVVAADGHLVFAPYLGETVGLLHVSGAEGLRVTASQASEVDSDGYTLLPYLAPYAANAVELNISNAPLSARFDSTSAVVAPHAGSVVLLNFKRLTGYTLMLRARQVDGSAVPFAASVYDATGNLVGSVGQAGRIEAASDSLQGVLRVSWGEEASASCLIRYDLPRPAKGADEVISAQVNCVPTARAPSAAPSTGTAAADTPKPQASAPLPARAPLLLLLSDGSGQPLPDGAEVSLTSEPDRIGVVSRGRAMLRLTPDQAGKASLTARWSTAEGQTRQCALAWEGGIVNPGPTPVRCTQSIALAATGSAGSAPAQSSPE